MADEILRLRVQLAEARKDTARLDAVDGNVWHVISRSFIAPDARGFDVGSGNCWGIGGTLRIAIDAAIDAALGDA